MARLREGAARLLLVAGSLPVALGLGELGARLSGADRRSLDPVLGFRMRPDGREIDPRGFRNGPRAVDAADVVAIGDSQTYGVNASLDDSWPRQLQGLTGRTVYNLGMGGYGPLQYDALVGEALRLRPREILIAVYPTNDVADVCGTFLQFDHWRRADVGTSLAYCDAVAQGPHSERPRGPTPSSLWNVLRGGWEKARYLRMRAGPELAVAIGATRTRISVEAVTGLRDYVDLDREEIARSAAVTEGILERARGRAEAAGVHLGVLLIPLKDTVLAPTVPAGAPHADVLHDLARKEGALRARLAAFLAGRGIDHVDATPHVLEALRGPRPVFFGSDQRHPTGAGYLAYARAAAELLEHAAPGP